MAFSKITTRGMSGDTLEAGDIAPNAIGASELADNAVATDAIAATSITEAKLNADVTDGSAIQTPSKPHIQPGLLYPAYQGYLGEIDNVGAIADTSTSAHQITNIDNYTVATSGQKTGTGYLDTNSTTGSGGSHLTIGSDNTPDFQFGTGAFTIEYWVKEDDYDYGDHGHFTTSQGAVGWAIQRASTYIYFTAQGDVYGSAPTSGNKIIARANMSGHVSNDTWYHVAIVRASTSNLKIYINGTDRTAEADAGGTYGWGWNNTSNDYNLVLGRSYPTSEEKHTVGGFDDIRITKGLAVYTGNFTAPASTLTTTWSAGTNIAANADGSKVKLLMTSDHSTVTSTQHSGAYGTAQSDGRSYYYTDIKGSKPIKDPRIGAHFGSQRHMFQSYQLLEQEMATHGKQVYSVDGREWIRRVGNEWSHILTSNGNWIFVNNTAAEDSNFIEITGYFSAANWVALVETANDVNISIDGTANSSTFTGGTTTVASPIANHRYVNSHSLVALTFDSTPTLGIHTIRLSNENGEYMRTYGIELIAQDTTSTATKSKIQIPSQNVVSYGKKFTVSGTPHYNPFDGMSGAKTLAQLGTYIDTATSYGMDNWKGGTSNYYKPFNGGRVVKWVDSSGTIKTSVTMIPPNAQNISGTPYESISDSEVQIGTNTNVLNFNGKTIDHSLSEVAKTYNWREFGNGAANGGTGATFADASMLSPGNADDIAYVMDDGLTSLTGDDALAIDISGTSEVQLAGGQAPCALYYTFIGTGVSMEGRAWNGSTVINYTIAQNLPYGTHILKIDRDTSSNMKITLDGVVVDNTNEGHFHDQKEITFHQPKKPPVPEDACILADYMLMADFVGIPASTAPADALISKGTRYVSPSRDMFYNTPNNSFTFAAVSPGGDYPVGSYIYTGSGTTSVASLPFFGVNVDITKYSSRTILLVDSETSETGVTNPSSVDSGSWNNHAYKTTNLTLGLHTVHHKPNGSNHWNHGGVWVATPIHTSSHYQSFESPFLHELIGGDRNMEQHNLVVTPDGKTWDQLTRDTSYLGARVEMHGARDGGHTTSGNIWFGDYWRGLADGKYHFNKGIAIAHDRVIILEDGYYEVSYQNYHHGADAVMSILKNNTTGGVDNGRIMRNDDGDETVHGMRRWHCKRGDWFTVRCDAGVGSVADGSNVGYNEFRIIKIG